MVPVTGTHLVARWAFKWESAKNFKVQSLELHFGSSVQSTLSLATWLCSTISDVTAAQPSNGTAFVIQTAPLDLRLSNNVVPFTESLDPSSETCLKKYFPALKKNSPEARTEKASSCPSRAWGPPTPQSRASGCWWPGRRHWVALCWVKALSEKYWRRHWPRGHWGSWYHSPWRVGDSPALRSSTTILCTPADTCWYDDLPVLPGFFHSSTTLAPSTHSREASEEPATNWYTPWSMRK
mmetsp:Transcript_10652/g.25317  ORF Transcript_10652/g.25317 Transcript_10652/m.25317 type:complete len:238 (-) Transcript_10652:122-835(-)